MRLHVNSRDVQCPVCEGTSFSRRYFSGGKAGVILRREKSLLTRPVGRSATDVARFYACDACSWTAIFAADTPGVPQEVG